MAANDYIAALLVKQRLGATTSISRANYRPGRGVRVLLVGGSELTAGTIDFFASSISERCGDAGIFECTQKYSGGLWQRGSPH